MTLVAIHSNQTDDSSMHTGDEVADSIEPGALGSERREDISSYSCGMPELKVCHGCHCSIAERFYLRVGDRSWHQQCLRCQVCQRCLNEEERCYHRNGRIYCREDYMKLFGARSCSRCQEWVMPTEMVMKVRSFVYHLACFSCYSCDRQLCPGEYFGMDADRVLCRLHYDILKEQWGGSDRPDLPGGLAAGVPGLHKGDADDGSHCGPGALSSTGVMPKNPKGRPRKKKTSKMDDADACEGNPESPRGAAMMSSSNCSADPTSVPTPASGVGGAPNSVGGSAYEGPGSVGTSLDDCAMDGSSMVGSPDRGSNAGGGGSASTASSSHPQRQKRVRTSFKHHQLRTMKSYFAINHNPDAKDLKQLAEKTGLSKRVLQVWFQNARAKFRRSLVKHSADGSGCLTSGHKLSATGGDQTAGHKLCSTDSNGNAMSVHHHLEHATIHHGAYLRQSLSESQHSPSQSDVSSNASLPDLSMGLELSVPPPPPPPQHHVTPMTLSLPVY